MALPAPSTTAEVLLHDIAQSLRDLTEPKTDVKTEPKRRKTTARKVRSE